MGLKKLGNHQQITIWEAESIPGTPATDSYVVGVVPLDFSSKTDLVETIQVESRYLVFVVLDGSSLNNEFTLDTLSESTWWTTFGKRLSDTEAVKVPKNCK
jgi:hypothetical protein